MELRTQLAQNLYSESKAYGYTLSVWGVGELLIYRYGMPNPLQISLYIGGGLLAFGALVYVAFDEVFTADQLTDDSGFAAASAVHLLATGGNVLAAYLTILVLPAHPEWLAFAIAGGAVTAGYNVLLLSETYVVRELVGGGSSTESGD